MANHRAFLGVYLLQIKNKFGKNIDIINTNDFLSEAYQEKDKKFEEGFIQDIIKLFDLKTFKNDKNTHGGILNQSDFNNSNRTLDLLINGGITGIKQYIINEDKETKEVSDKDTVGLKFFARIWLPSNSNSAYVFIQKYGSLSIKSLFDDMLKKVLQKNQFGIVGRKLRATTTKKRLNEFLTNSNVSDITLISKKSAFDTSSVYAKKASIKFSGITKRKNYIDREDVDRYLIEHGLSISNKDYDTTVTYSRITDGFIEKKTSKLDVSEETINIIPNVIIPEELLEDDNSPNFEKMQLFVSREMEILKKEAKKS
jgi:hypothetical protein